MLRLRHKSSKQPETHTVQTQPQRAHKHLRRLRRPAGGTGTDSMTMAIAHTEDGRAVLDVVREVRPPFSPETVVAAFASTFKAYVLAQVTSDRYAGQWPVEAFQKVGVTVQPSEQTRSDIYLTVLPMVMSARVELLDHPRLLKQLASLERRKGRHGKDAVDAPPRQHEDVANTACGALVLAAGRDAAKTVENTRWALELNADDGNRRSYASLPMDSADHPDPSSW